VNNLNEAFENELYFQFLKDPESVSPEWRAYFSNIATGAVVPDFSSSNNYGNISQNYQQSVVEYAPVTNGNAPAMALHTPKNNGISSSELKLASGETVEQLSSITSKIAENMDESLTVPTATSIRTIPVKALDENRRIINKFLEQRKKGKVSFTQIILWAIVKSLQKYPKMNAAYEVIDGKPHRRNRSEINLGVATDVVRKDGQRLLMVPNLKNAGSFNFAEFIAQLDVLVSKAKNNKLSLEDLEHTSVSLTNPGMIGTNASIPRLMKGQGLIIASGSIDYPVEFLAVKPELLSQMAVSKVVTITSTYDHRIIQGAESAEFLLHMHKLLIGEFNFYDQIFAALKIPFEPVKWQTDKPTRAFYSGNSSVDEYREKSALVTQLIHAYRVRGHLLASINPLGNDSYSYPELELSHYGFNIWDLEREFPADSNWSDRPLPLRSIVEILRDTYCGSIGIEYMHIADNYKRDWIRKKVETTRNTPKFSTEQKKLILSKLIEAETFENYLHTKFIGHKRFSLEGSETVVVFLDRLFQAAADSDVKNIVLGMAHRGRLNVLVNAIGKKLEYVFNEFDGNLDPELEGSGDVKYHLGEEGVYTSENGNNVNVRLAPNPSHLEIVNPVILGMAKAIAHSNNDKSCRSAMPVLIHGDAAFSGQGIGQEIFNMMTLEGYKNGGTIHVVINNQIGFTTSPDASRSTTYCSDIARMVQCPILHVNGNDPEAVALAAILANEYRNTFGNDVVIDILSYRKYGHNEGDEPSYTQPLLYKKIRSLQPIKEQYEKELISQKVLNDEEIKNIYSSYNTKLNEAFEKRKDVGMGAHNVKVVTTRTLQPVNTAISKEQIDLIKEALVHTPEHFNANPKVMVGLKKRKEMIDSVTPSIDWATAEALAFGSLLLEGKPVRLSGEDSRRGTFSQRHAVLVDSNSEEKYTPLNNITQGQEHIQVYDSPLSELGVLGFDYGYSVSRISGLTMWEAQFGDFANMAQPIIDQFIACGEVKWGQKSNLVLLLPHGHEGQGPEHSSARPERFLQLCAEDNMIVANYTTPANYFHALRRQVYSEDKVPLVIMTPKSLLRHALAVSSAKDLTEGTYQHIIDDAQTVKSNAKRVIITSGKIYYDLVQLREQHQKQDIAILRIEQLYPLHKSLLKELLAQYANSTEVLWVQEEPKNQGAWLFLADDIRDLLNSNQKLSYIGRVAMAATATGSSKVHAKEHQQILENAILNSL
jgi:2-oxoglutarate dehydrogenase E1 component